LTVSLLERRGRASAADPLVDALTPRELEVAQLVAQGLTNNEIADQLFLSLSTVKTHLANISTRWEARNRVEVAARVWRSGRA
jgi:DNA-binding NarL/FixJ family response regulator